MTKPYSNLTELLEASVTRYASRLALRTPSAQGYDEWTYARLWRDVRQVAGRLHDCGVASGDMVGVLSESRAAWAISDFAVTSLGACVVPVYPSLPAGQIQYIVAHAGMKGMFVQNEAQLAKLLAIPEEQIPSLRFLVLYDDDIHPTTRAEAARRWVLYDFSEWLNAADAWTEEAWLRHVRAVGQEQLATIVYTSGTTGTPKGVMLSHDNLLSNVEGIQQYVKLYPDDVSLSYLPLSHIFERTAGLLIPLAAGSLIVYSRGIADVPEEFRTVAPTTFTTVPRLLEKVHEQVLKRMADAPGWQRSLFQQAVVAGTRARVQGQAVPSWRLRLYDKLVFSKIHEAVGGRMRMVVVGGAPMPRYVGEFFTAAGLTVVEGYGMTETSPVVCVNPPDAVRLGTAGKVLPNVEVKIAEDGEILVRGPSVTRGYYRNEEATREAFTEDGFLRTGDIGELSADGYLKITDRKKNLLILSTGKNVTPAPIEAEILRSPYIDQVLLVGHGYKFVSAIVVPNEPAVREWLIAQGRPGVPRERWRHDEALQAFLLHEVEEAVKSFARFEQPKKIIIAEPFTVENGMLTPTLKVRARQVLDAYREDIEALYTSAAAAQEIAASHDH
ncbi:MAG: long-chain fatty acid--CoA ligase [Thermoflavifilum sp.]|nr:long-chain fatty acid--CoA ligase [Thermoflavifilum sp.]MCL6513883.1 long-chain fatty acid--CoA ligase [Alicyclobacillus sp.]